MATKKLAVVAVESKLLGAIVKPMEGVEHAPRTWPFPLSEVNLSGERTAEVVAVFVGNLDEGGTLQLALRSTINNRIGIAAAELVRVMRFEEGR
jgi:hypothetical protein